MVSEGRDLGLLQVWGLAQALDQRTAFRTSCGLVGKSVLDYPPGFRFAPARGVTAEAGGDFVLAEPGYVVWSGAGVGGQVFTVAYWSAERLEFRWPDDRHWEWPELVEEAPVVVRRHQWLVRGLTEHRLPQERRGVGL